jgi:hypothetical protein
MATIGGYIMEVVHRVDDVTLGLGNIGNRLGDQIELIVVPKIHLCMNACGHEFKRLTVNKVFTVPTTFDRMRKLAEVDIFLSNGTEAMAVEVKTNLTNMYVHNHINQLQNLREYEEDVGLRDKKWYGAMVGLEIDSKARKAASEHGIYVVEILEDKDRLKVNKPAKRRAW